MSLQLVGEPVKKKNKEIYQTVELVFPGKKGAKKQPPIEVEVGDPVLIHAGKGAKPYIALLTKLYRDTTRNESLIKCRWFYRVSDVPHNVRKTKKLKNNEVLLSNIEDVNPLESIKNIAYITFYGTDRTIQPRKVDHARDVPYFICRRIFMAKSLKIRPLVVSEISVLGVDTKQSQRSQDAESMERNKAPDPISQARSHVEDSTDDALTTNRSETEVVSVSNDRAVVESMHETRGLEGVYEVAKTDTNTSDADHAVPISEAGSGSAGEKENVDLTAEPTVGTSETSESFDAYSASKTEKNASQRQQREQESGERRNERDAWDNAESDSHSTGSGRMIEEIDRSNISSYSNDESVDTEISSLAALTSQGSATAASNSKTLFGERWADLAESSAAGRVPLRRDILIRKKERKPQHLKMMNKENGYERTESRVGDRYQAPIPPLSGSTTSKLVEERGCAWSPPGNESVDKETISRYLRSVVQVIHSVYIGVRVGAFHPKLRRFCPGVIVAIRLPPSVATHSSEFCRKDYSLYPGTVVDVLFDKSDTCVRYDARDVEVGDTYRSVSEEAALEILMDHNYDVGNALKKVSHVHASHLEHKEFIPHLDGTEGPSPLRVLDYKPPQVRVNSYLDVTTPNFSTEKARTGSNSDSESVSSGNSVPESRGKDENEKGTKGDNQFKVGEDITQQMILRALLTLPPGWTAEEKHLYSVGFNRYGKSFHRIHALMCRQLGWSETNTRALAQTEWKRGSLASVLRPKDMCHDTQESKTVNDLVWFYYTTKYQRRFVDAPAMDSATSVLSYYGTLRAGRPSVASYVSASTEVGPSLSSVNRANSNTEDSGHTDSVDDTPQQGEESTDLDESVAQDRPRRLASSMRQASGLGYSENILSVASTNYEYGAQPYSSNTDSSYTNGRILLCTNPRCVSTRRAAMTESQFRTFVSSLRTIGRPSWREAYHNPWWYCFDCCPPFPSRLEASIVDIRAKDSEQNPALLLYGQGKGTAGSWEVLKTVTRANDSLSRMPPTDSVRRKRGPPKKEKRSRPASKKTNNSNPVGRPRKKARSVEGTSPTPETDSAQCFLSHVQCFYQVVGKTENYEKLLEYLAKYQKHEFNVNVLVKKVRDLLADAPTTLLSEFKNFVPEEARGLVDAAVEVNKAEQQKQEEYNATGMSRSRYAEREEDPSQFAAQFQHQPPQSMPEAPVSSGYWHPSGMTPHGYQGYQPVPPQDAYAYWSATPQMMPPPETSYMYAGMQPVPPARSQPMYPVWGGGGMYQPYAPWGPQYPVGQSLAAPQESFAPPPYASVQFMPPEHYMYPYAPY
eukprot:gb/GECG01004910.1/.p1 GENE.gb/GECG01004910.1/~~gb/GECG01004910.1/.p1  ORF type:complete len:1309 (+),score=173.34 gb/GECG01004910.1/:1-3927(+)